MGSEGNKMNGADSFQPSEPILCANGCGFFGTASRMNLCSKCFASFRLQEEQSAAAKAALDKLVNPTPAQADASHVDGLDSSSSSTPAVAEEASKPSSTAERAASAGEKRSSNRCWVCKRKVGVMGFGCRCGCTFCGAHRYPESHGCTFDFKVQGREEIAKANPVVKGDKIQRF